MTISAPLRRGLFRVDGGRLREINLLGDAMIATRHGSTAVRRGDKLCGTRVIPLVIEEEKLLRAEAIGGGRPRPHGTGRLWRR